MTIQNVTDKKISFDYSIILYNTLNISQWQYQNVVTINPNATVDIGEINKSQVGITAGGAKILIQSNLITYQ